MVKMKSSTMEKSSKSKKIKVCIHVPSNREYFYKEFAESLYGMFIYANSKGIHTDIQPVSACSIENMRNLGCRKAVEDGYTHILMLDDDHIYPKDLVITMLKHDKDFVCGHTYMRKTPFFPTQYKKIFADKTMNTEENRFKFKGDEGLVKIEATGMAGVMVKAEVLKKVGFPYFELIYTDGRYRGSDLTFCQRLKDNNIELFCDSSLVFPHRTIGWVDNKGIDFN